MLKKEAKRKWKELSEIMAREQNFTKLRAHLHCVDPPCTALPLLFISKTPDHHTHSPGIPYLGVYLTDLTFIEEGNKDFINGSLINFDKRRKIAQVIMEIQQYQATPYCLQEVPALREFLCKLESFDENEAYANSLKVTQPTHRHTHTHTKEDPAHSHCGRFLPLRWSPRTCHHPARPWAHRGLMASSPSRERKR